MQQRSLLEAIDNNPKDALSKMAYADWLEDNTNDDETQLAFAYRWAAIHGRHPKKVAFDNSVSPGIKSSYYQWRAGSSQVDFPPRARDKLPRWLFIILCAGNAMFGISVTHHSLQTAFFHLAVALRRIQNALKTQ